MKNIVLAALTAALVMGCISSPVTTLEVSWVAPQPSPAASFKKLLIITVASNEFVQAAFQDQLAKQLTARGVNAVASGRYFTRYTDAEKARFKKSIQDSGADFVLLARVTTTSDKATENRGTIICANGLPCGDAVGVDGAFAKYTGSYMAGGDFSETTVTAEASIFATQGEKLVWSARTRTTHANRTTDADLTRYLDVILEAMKKDRLL